MDAARSSWFKPLESPSGMDNDTQLNFTLSISQTLVKSQRKVTYQIY
jgi:hypothetical protein